MVFRFDPPVDAACAASIARDRAIRDGSPEASESAALAPGSQHLGSCRRHLSRLPPTNTHRFESGRLGRSGWDRARGSRVRGSGGEPAA